MIVETDARGVSRWVSPSVQTVLGWRAEEVTGVRAKGLVHPDDLPVLADHFDRLRELAPESDLVAVSGDARVRWATASGGYKSLSFRARPAFDDDGVITGFVVTLQDTSERDDALRALSVLSEGNRVLARASDEESLMQQMCEAIVSVGQFALAWYGQAMHDAARSVAKRAVAGPASDYVQRIDVSWGDDALGAGPTGTALRTGSTQVRHDVGTGDDAFAPWHVAAVEAGLRSSISLPVIVDGEVDGVLVVAASDPRSFDEHATALLETLASDLGLGLHRLRSLRALEVTTQEAQRQRERLRGVFTSQFDPFVLLEAVRDEAGQLVDLRYVEASDAAIDHNGLPREQLIGGRMSELFPGLVEDGTIAAYFRTIETGEPLVIDDRRYYHEQRQRWFTYDVRAVKVGDAVAIAFRDVSQRAEAARRLQDSEARYRLLAENASDVVWQAESSVGITWVSESARTVLGWDPDDLVGRDLDVVHPDDLAETSSNLQGLDRGQIVEGRCRIARADGGWLWMAYTAHRIESATGLVDVVALRDVDDEVRAREALLHAVGHDPLTGMAARPTMVRRVSDTLQRLSGQRLAAVLCIGIDRLSAINDAFTHTAGDLVLTVVATRIAEAAGSPELVGRGAGVEFLVVLPDLAAADDAVTVAEAILARAKGPVAVDDRVVEPTVSIGIAVGDRRADAEQLVRDASMAMGQAKADGRDRFTFADASLSERAKRRLEVEGHVRAGLETDRLLAHFQPVVDLASSRVEGYEALVRFVRGDGSIGMPGRFMPIVESTPLVADVDVAMLRQGLAALEGLPEPLSVAVNLSPVTLVRPGYAQLIEQLVREAPVAPSRLHLEVTETALLGDASQVLEAMTSIAGLGARWYVDDFGTGYSSISHLRDLPIAGLKLDVSFSAGIREGDVTSIRLAQALAGLAGGLGLDTVAEGIETEAEAEVLHAQGWIHGQGWRYGHAEPLH